MNRGKTKITTTMPWGLMRAAGSRVLCSDGKIRALHYLASTPDTFFSTPASIRIGRKVVTGYVTGDETVWCENRKTDFRKVYTFRQHTDQRHPGLLPDWPDKLKEPDKHNALIDGAYFCPIAHVLDQYRKDKSL